MLVVPPKVARQLSGMPRVDAGRLLGRLERIAADPDRVHAGVVALIGEPGVFRIRQGDWRAVYSVEEGNVILDRVAHRREVYR